LAGCIAAGFPVGKSGTRGAHDDHSGHALETANQQWDSVCASTGRATMKDTFAMFAAYNRWANGRLYEAAGALSGEEWGRGVGAFFGSMMGTLNHLLAADRIWMRRFTGKGEAPARLDAVLFPAFDDLLPAREAEDRRIADYVGSLGEADLAGTFTYTPITIPDPVTQRLSPALSHFFNHQTHHRGQAHAILSQLGKAPPVLDLIFFHRTPEGRPFA
jgi:uncharacterized damage-inducible protein DinB